MQYVSTISNLTT